MNKLSRKNQEKYWVVLDYLFKKSPLNGVSTSLGWALSLYTLGYVVSRLWNFEDLFLETLLIKHIAFAFFLALYTFSYARDDLITILKEIEPIFRVTRSEYKKLVSAWLERIFNNRAWIFTWLIVSLLAFGALYGFSPIATEGQAFAQGFPVIRFREILSPDWFTPPVAPKFIVVGLFLLVGALPLSACLWAAPNLLLMFFKMTELEIAPQPGAVNLILRPFTSLIMGFSLTYSVLTASTTIVLFDEVSFTIVLIILLIGSIGITGFLIPQVAFYKIMQKSYRSLALKVIHATNEKESKKKNSKYDATIFLQYDISTSQSSFWVFDYGHLFILIMGEFVPVLFGYVYTLV